MHACMCVFICLCVHACAYTCAFVVVCDLFLCVIHFCTGARRLRVDQIEVFKILNGYDNIDSNIVFLFKKDSRGHGVTLVKNQRRLDIRSYSFSQRTIN